MSPAARYWLAQLPGYAIGAILLSAASHFFALPGWLAALLFAGMVLKDVAFYPLARRALAAPPWHGAESLLGQRGVVVAALEPEGKVRIGHELWRARAARADAPIAAGRAVRVEAVRGLTLVVAPDARGD
jgi:membrane protein implicated in regulation of membrane protease activity